MSLADRKMLTRNAAGKLDGLLADLPKADSKWLRDHLTARDSFGNYAYSAAALSAELADEGPEVYVGKTAILEWRKRNR